MKPASPEQALFAEALQRETREDRAAYLQLACGNDAALRLRVEALLLAADNAGDFLETPPAELSEVDDAVEIVGNLREKPGDRIGRYKLLEKIGEGGCGAVYMAEQEEPVHRRVALKVIKLGMDTRSVIARFEAERQALALMDHPNIAKVLDGGATQTGRPYFVMELVRGVRITEFCDEARLSTEARLRLFVQVCLAVQHAHQKGIIHRDLKPSNILVTVNDGAPVPKVIDFGIAKATGQRLTDKTLFTQFHTFMGTPAYTSPEQAEMSSVDIDTRSDIYSLGVLLYELLTGRTPFDGEQLLRSGLDEMRRIIRDEQPSRPSSLLDTLGLAEATTVSAKRRASISELSHEVRGDLDWIAMKCLEKDRSRRYETASGLGADLQRHISNEPVAARPPSAGYRFQKLVRRNKLAFAASGAVCVALVLGVVVSTLQAVRATRAERAQSRLRRQAEASSAHAQQEAAKSQQVAQFMKDMLKGVGPATAMGRDTVMLREILDKTARRLNALTNQPAVEADLRATLGGVYADLGEHTNAIAMYRKSLALRRKLLGDEHPQLAQALNDFSVVLYAPGKFAEAEALCREALVMRRKLLGAEHVDVSISLDNLARILEAQGRADDAVATWREALAMRRKLRGNQHESVGYVLHPLAWTLGGQGKWAEAEALSREELMIWRKHLGDQHPNVGWALGDLSTFLVEQGKLVEAEGNAREALVVARNLSGSNPASVATFLRALGAVLHRQKKQVEAEELVREELALRRKVQGHEHTEVATTLHRLALILRAQNKTSEAEVASRDALRIGRMRLGDEHASVANSLKLLADLLREQGEVEESESVAAEALAIQRKVHGDEHPDVAKGIAARAIVLQKEGKFSEAELYFRQAIASFEKLARKNPQHSNHRVQLGHIQWQLGYALGAAKRLEEAEQVFLQALQIFEQAGVDFPNDRFHRQEQAFTRRQLAGVAKARGQTDDAERHYRKAIDIYVTLIDESPQNAIYSSEKAFAVSSLTQLLQQSGKPAEAVK